MPLSTKDKSRASHGFGFDFHHTEPQRHVPCVLGEMLCPRSADDIAPISQDAMTSVMAALELLANLVEDRDRALCMGAYSDTMLAETREHAKHIRLAAKGVAAILRVAAPTDDAGAHVKLAALCKELGLDGLAETAGFATVRASSTAVNRANEMIALFNACVARRKGIQTRTVLRSPDQGS